MSRDESPQAVPTSETGAADEHAPIPSRVRRFRAHVRITGFGLCVLALGLLIWARLMLVTNHPRIAVAEPAHPLVVSHERPARSAPMLPDQEPQPHPTAMADQN
ncbi:MAG TPA: hypothetical protein PL072_11400 [Phycisphaerales bacterium]|nr:hypothetical protein [Phycisphaerales bacterium]